MNLTNQTVVLTLMNKLSKVGIIGYPGAGKTTLSLKSSDKPVVHTDDYLKTSHDDRPMKIMGDLAAMGSFIVEGNEVTRLVNRGLALDALIMVVGTERHDKSVKGLQGRVDKFIDEYDGKIPIYVVHPRDE